MTRVVHVVPTYWPAIRYGGPVASVDALARAQVGLGAQVDVHTTTVDGRGDIDVTPDVAIDRGGVRVWYHRVPWLRRVYHAPTLGRRIAREIERVGVVHLHSVFLWPTTAAARHAARAGVPYVVSPRGMLVRRLIDARGRLRKLAWIALFERTTLARAALIHATSAEERDELRDVIHGPLPPITVIPNGVDLPDDPGGVRGDRFLFVGRLSWKKRVDWAVRGIAEVPGAVLDVVGPDDEGLTPRLLALAHELRVADRVRFHGMLAPPDRDALMWRARALVLPSISENFGNVVTEALACRCPAIVTDGVGAASIVRSADAGRVVADATGLARAMRDLAVDPQSAERAGKRGRRYVAQQLAWPAVAARMLECYRDVVALRARGT